MSEHSILLLAIGDPATDRRTQNFKQFFKSEGWRVEVISVHTRAMHGPSRFLEYHRKLAHAVRSKSAEVVLAGDLYSLSAAVWMKQNSRTKRVIYDSREVYTELPRVASRPIVKFVWRTLERRGLLKTDAVIVTAPRDAQAICDVHDFLPRPVLVRNLPQRVDHSVRDRSLLNSYAISSDTQVVVYLGGLQKGRGLKNLIGTMHTLPEVHLLLIGDGVMRAELETHASPNVHFAGAIPSDRAMEIVAACDVGICLVEPISRSYELALSSKLFEYMMCGIPVVSSRLEQVLDLFPNEEWITYADESDSDSIRNAIESALTKGSNPLLREQERALALSEYHFEHDASKLLTMIERLLPQ